MLCFFSLYIIGIQLQLFNLPPKLAFVVSVAFCFIYALFGMHALAVGSCVCIRMCVCLFVTLHDFSKVTKN